MIFSVTSDILLSYEELNELLPLFLAASLHVYYLPEPSPSPLAPCPAVCVLPFAYLLPAIHASLRNKKRVLVTSDLNNLKKANTFQSNKRVLHISSSSFLLSPRATYFFKDKREHIADSATLFSLMATWN